MSQPPSQIASAQFTSLDALRGFAALGVMLFHDKALGSSIMPGGYLAVDLFFLLSGFVIAHAYCGRMQNGLRPRAFLYRRAIRLWPMLALGALAGIVLHGGHVGSLLLLPNFKSAGNLFPANPPLWSLLFEVLAYGAFALGAWRLGPRILGLLAGVSGLALVWLTFATGPLVDFGAHWPSLAGGLARIAFGFSAGMLLWHLWQARQPAHQPTRQRTNRAWLLPVALGAIMAGVTENSAVLALLAICIAFPAIMWLALCWEFPQIRLARALGDISYPLYCIHVPLLVWLTQAGTNSAWVLCALPVAALMLDRLVDRPARAGLSRLLARDAGLADQTRIGIST